MLWNVQRETFMPRPPVLPFSFKSWLEVLKMTNNQLLQNIRWIFVLAAALVDRLHLVYSFACYIQYDFPRLTDLATFNLNVWVPLWVGCQTTLNGLKLFYVKLNCGRHCCLTARRSWETTTESIESTSWLGVSSLWILWLYSPGPNTCMGLS